MKKYFCFTVVFLLAMTCFYGCGKNEIDLEDATRFIEYSQSCATNNTTMDFTFFTKKPGLALWSNERILGCSIKVGNVETPARINQVDVSDRPIYDEYYMGNISVNADLKEAQGEACLVIQFDTEESVCEFSLGTLSILDNGSTTFDSVSQLIAGGVVATDENDNVFTYGIIVHCEIAEPITITEIGLGLNNVGLIADDCIIYTPSEYQGDIVDLIDNTEYDQLVPMAYTKQYAEYIDKSADIELDAGEYYIYFPVVITDDDVPAVNQASIVFKYRAQSGEDHTFVSSSWPFFSEMTKSVDMLEKMFLDS